MSIQLAPEKKFVEPLKSVEVTVSSTDLGVAMTFNILARLSADEDLIRRMAITKLQRMISMANVKIGNAYIQLAK